MKIVSILNLKGGVAKTTTAINMGHILATRHNKKTLIFDNDKQANPSKFFGLHSNEDKSVSDILTVENISIKDIIKPTKYKNLDLVPANMSLLEANLIAITDQEREQHTRFLEAFESIQNEYDYCIIDNAPDINISTINALVASSEMIIPVKIDGFTFDGLAELLEQVHNTAKSINKNLKLGGCLITQFYNREVNIQGENWLRTQSKFPIYKSRIHRTEKVDESTFAGVPILEYSRLCRATRDYLAFVDEFVNG